MHRTGIIDPSFCSPGPSSSSLGLRLGSSRRAPRPFHAPIRASLGDETPQTSPKEQILIRGFKWMDELQNNLAERSIEIQKGRGRRVLIAIAGGPGSGKTTLSSAVKRIINEKAGSVICEVLPMDGFHYYRQELDQFPNRVEAHARRGSHWTFDSKRFVECVQRAKSDPKLKAPSFDHGVGDPCEDAISIEEKHVIVLVEGNYVLLDLEPWTQLPPLFDETWFVNCSVDTAMRRVYRRQTAIGLRPDESRRRIRDNDRPNAELIATCKPRADVLLPSLPLRSAAAVAASKEAARELEEAEEEEEGSKA